jgi:peroxisomal enoyl-CoA hydratase 2
LQELHPEFAVFPTYSIILRGSTCKVAQRCLLTCAVAFKKTTQEVIDFYAAQESNPIPGVPKLDSRRVLDGQRMIQFLKPLPPTSAGKKFELRSKVIGVYDKGKPGTVVETEQTIVDASTGEVYTRAVGSGFFVGQGGWGGPKGPSAVNYPPPKGKENSPDLVVEKQLTAESAHLYR